MNGRYLLDLIIHINSLIDFSRKQSEQQNAGKLKENSLGDQNVIQNYLNIKNLTTDLKHLIKSKKDLLKDEQILFNTKWNIFITNPTKNIDKIGSLKSVFKKRLEQVPSYN